MEIINYTDKSIVVKGDLTKTYKEDLKKLGGRFNAHLKLENGTEFCGWVFSKKHENDVNEFINKIKKSVNIK